MAILGLWLVHSPLPAAAPDQMDHPFAKGRIIVKMKPGAEVAEKGWLQSELDAVVSRQFSRTGAELWDISGVSVKEAIAHCQKNPLVEYAEPDYIVSGLNMPFDPHFSLQWGLDNTGQTSGTADADIDALEAWDIETGSDVVIAVIDTGVDYTNPDLAPNMWVNPGEIPGNGIDDDSNGFVDDIHGYDFFNNDGDPMDDRFHGTHVAGIAAAAGDNGLGVTGTSWSAKIMAIKFIDSNNEGTISGAIASIEYATNMGARLSNNSWGSGDFSQALRDTIEDARDAGQLFVAGAGNNGVDNDQNPFYPASYDLDNIISVAATDHDDNIPAFSHFGAISVDLAAPGVDIFSTFLPFVNFDGLYACNDDDGDGYGYCAGTSTAAPFVTGTAALLWAAYPQLQYSEVKSLILNNVDPVPALNGITVTGGRLNAKKALDAAAPSNQPPVAVDDLYLMTPDRDLNIFYNDLLSNDLDPDGDSIGVAAIPGPLPSGSYCGFTGQYFCFHSDPGFTGEVVIPYSVTDGALQSSGSIRITVDSLFADNFDSGDTSAWDQAIVSGGGVLRVDAASSIVGPFGMSSLLSAAGNAAWVRDNSPVSELFYRAKFQFWLKDVRMTTGNQHNIFVVYDDSPSAWVVLIDMRRHGLSYQLRARTRLDSGSVVSTPWTTVSSAAASQVPHEVEVEWKAASGFLNNGSLRFFVDGAPTSLLGLDNHTRRIDHVRFGIVSGVDAGTEGAFVFDEFESWNQ